MAPLRRVVEPDDFAPIERGPIVREHLKTPGYDYPPGNILVAYFNACEEQAVFANSAVVSELLLRARSLWPLPYYKIVGLTTEQKCDLMFQHLDADASGFLTEEELMATSEYVDPRVKLQEAKGMLTFMDKNQDGKVSPEEFRQAMMFMFKDLSQEELDQSVMEVLSYRHALEHMSREGMFRSMFHHLDKDVSGFLELAEIRMVSITLSTDGDWHAARKQMDHLDKNSDSKVSVDEFVEAMMKLTEGLSPSELVSRANFILNRKGHVYDFSRAYVGDKGLDPLLKALETDHEFKGIILSNCGIRNRGCKALAEFVAVRPEITSIVLSNNSISNEGGVALEDMLRRNPSITHLDLEGNRLHTPYSWTHCNLGPPPCPNVNVIEELLEQNRRTAPKDPVDTREWLMHKKEDLKTLFYSIANPDGLVDEETLEKALGEWDQLGGSGLLPKEIIDGINPQRMYEMAEKTELNFSEFLWGIKREDTVSKVTWVIKNRRQEIKVLFYSLLGKSTKLSVQQMLDGIENAMKDHNWGISIEEISEVLTPSLFNRSEAVGTHESAELSWPEFINPILAITTRSAR